MEIIRTPLGSQHEKIVIKIPAGDFIQQFEEELRKYRQKANLRGFRKGKAPGDYVKKLVGKALLAEVVEKKLEKSMQDFISEHKLHVLGQPILAEGQPINNIDPFEVTDQEFHFELGYAPELQLKGMTKEDVYTMHLVEVLPEKIQEQLSRSQRTFGTLVETEEAIGEEDTLEIEAKELEQKEEKPQGHTTYFVCALKDVNDDLKASLIGQKAGYIFDADIYQLEKNRTEDYVKKYLLNLDQDEQKEINPNFRMKVAKVKTLKPAELDQAFYDRAFGEGKVQSLEEAEAKIKEFISQSTQKSSEALLYRQFQDRLMEINELELPDEFLKKWLSTKENSEKILADYPTFQQNLRWTLIRDYLTKTKEISVNQKDLRQYFLYQVYRYIGYNRVPENYLWIMVDRLMEDEKEVSRAYDELLTEKLYDAIVAEVTVENKYVTEEQFKDLMEQARKTATPEVSDLDSLSDVQVEIAAEKDDQPAL